MSRTNSPSLKLGPSRYILCSSPHLLLKNKENQVAKVMTCLRCSKSIYRWKALSIYNSSLFPSMLRNHGVLVRPERALLPMHLFRSSVSADSFSNLDSQAVCYASPTRPLGITVRQNMDRKEASRSPSRDLQTRIIQFWLSPTPRNHVTLPHSL